MPNTFRKPELIEIMQTASEKSYIATFRGRQAIQKTLAIVADISILLLLVLAGAPDAYAKVTVGGPVGDRMVIQRDKPIRIFGTTEPGEVIGVRLADMKAVTSADENGRWLVSLDRMPAGGPHELLVVGAQERILFKDVMVGEVWTFIGESPLGASSAELAARSASPAESNQKSGDSRNTLRILKLPLALASKPASVINAQWIELESPLDENSENPAVKEISRSSDPAQSLLPAIPVAFARELQEVLSVPVGIIVATAHGSTIESWMSKESLQSFREGGGLLGKEEEQFQLLRARLQNLLSRPATGRSEQSESSSGATSTKQISDREIGVGLRVLEASRTSELEGIYPVSALYNGMLANVIPSTARGIVWFQGSSNVKSFLGYPKYFAAMVKDWRKQSDDLQLPVLFVQALPKGKKSEKPLNRPALALFRQAQDQCKLVPRTYLVPSSDAARGKIPGWQDIDYELISGRLVDTALATQHNLKRSYRAPSAGMIRQEGNKLRIEFSFCEGGLALSDGKELRGFVLAGEDKTLVKANAVIDGDSVLVWSDSVRTPIVVAYNWADNPEGNLIGGSGLPAMPFQKKIEKQREL